MSPCPVASCNRASSQGTGTVVGCSCWVWIQHNYQILIPSPGLPPPSPFRLFPASLLPSPYPEKPHALAKFSQHPQYPWADTSADTETITGHPPSAHLYGADMLYGMFATTLNCCRQLVSALGHIRIAP